MRAPSMTLSESQAMEDFDFLGSEDNILLARFSRASFSDVPEGESRCSAPVVFSFAPVIMR